jgi:ketosteroid isomerase-like protein
MSSSNAKIVRRIYESWSADQIPGPVELFDADVQYVNPTGAIEPGTRRGLEAFTAASRKVFDAWDYWRCEVEQLSEIGDSVVAVVRYRTRGHGSGVEIEGRESALWTFRNGKVIRYEWFHGPEDAAAAARREP